MSLFFQNLTLSLARMYATWVYKFHTWKGNFWRAKIIKKYKEFFWNEYVDHVNPGWYKLFYNFCKEAEKLPVRILITDVKEKYGTMRIYTQYQPNVFLTQNENREMFEEIDRLEEKYEELSSRTCDICGKEGKLYSKTFWMKTRCEKHEKI